MDAAELWVAVCWRLIRLNCAFCSEADQMGVTFRYKDYRIKGPGRYKTMTPTPGEFIRRFMLHVLPNGFHRIRRILLRSLIF
jgi:hypothetical protein